MVNRLVSVDENNMLPPEVQEQLVDTVRDEFTALSTTATTAATNASDSAAVAGTNAGLANTARIAAEAAAAAAEAPIDGAVAALVATPGSATHTSIENLIGTRSTGLDAPMREVPGAASASIKLAPVYRTAWMTTPWETGFAPDASGNYTELWTRDHAYVLWHMPHLVAVEEIAAFARNRIAMRSTSGMSDPDGGTLGAAGANFVADKIGNTGVATYKYAGRSKLPFMDGIAFTILAMYQHWRLTASNELYVQLKSEVDLCLAAIPRSANGAVYSNPAAPSVDYGFSDGILKTGDVAYGTALQAWSYKMMAEMAGESGSGQYTTARALAESGLRTLRKSTGWYSGSSGNNVAVDDVWVTALIVAESLCTDAEAEASSKTIRDAYRKGTLTERGWVRHLPKGQYWVGTTMAVNTFQNGGYWLTPFWDCYRAVARTDPDTAHAWASEAMSEVLRQFAAEGGMGPRTAPYEWFWGPTPSAAKGYSASAAIVGRFTRKAAPAYQIESSATDTTVYTLNTDPGWTLTGFTYDAVNQRYTSSGLVDGDSAIRPGTTGTVCGIAADVTFLRAPGPVFPSLFIRYVDGNNNVWATIGGATNQTLEIFQKLAGTITSLGSVALGANMVPGVRYPLSVSINGNSVRARLKHVVVTGTTALTTAGSVGLRHGRAGGGTTTYDNIRFSTVSATIANEVAVSATLPAGIMLSHDGGVIAPTDRIDGPMIGQYRVLDASGTPVSIGSAGASLVRFSAAMD